MNVYITATQEAFAVCIAQRLSGNPLGVLTIGNPPVLSSQDAQLDLRTTPWNTDGAVDSLAECDPIVVLADDAALGVEELDMLRQTLWRLLHASGALVFAPEAGRFAGIDATPVPAGDAHAGATREPANAALIPAAVLASVDHGINFTNTLELLEHAGKLIALDGPVYMEYAVEDRTLSVHGAGSVLLLTPTIPDQGGPVTAKAFILTDGMSQRW